VDSHCAIYIREVIYNSLSRGATFFLKHSPSVAIPFGIGFRATEDQLEPEELAELGPRDLSFFIASFFSDVKLLQQNVRAIPTGCCAFNASQ
jgi:hypothetical protein